MHFLPNTWEYIKKHLTHNIHTKSIENIMRYLELEEECLHFSKMSIEVYIVGSNFQNGKEIKHKH